MRHFIVVALLVIACTFLTHTAITSIDILPRKASAQAIPIDHLFEIQLWLISFLFSLVTVTLAYSLIVFRRRPGDVSEGVHVEGNTRLEILWTVAPLVTVIALAYLGARSLSEVQRADPNALQVEVLGGQWFWSFTYPEYGVTSDELYLPVSKQALLRMTSLDVIHSFWVPEFRVKQDLLPGKITELRVTPTETGEYTLLCAEMCGTSHAYMVAPVKVVSQEEFMAWIEEKISQAKLDPVQRGRKLANQYCTACHSIDGSQRVGPTWKGLFGSLVTLEDGTSVIADEVYLRNAIANPNLQIRKGYPGNVMPNFGNILTESQIEDLVAYIRSIE